MTAVTPGWVMLTVAETIIHLTLDRARTDSPGQSSQQTALVGKLQSLGPGMLGPCSTNCSSTASASLKTTS